MLRTRTRRVRHVTHRAGLSAIPFESLESRVLLSTIYVDASAPGVAQDGTSWGTAYQDLQLALAAAVAGDEVRVADGVYKPTSGTSQSSSFVPAAGVTLRGGYGGYGHTNPNQRDPLLTPSILSGEIGDPGSTLDNSWQILTLSDDTVVDGFHITAGAAISNGGAVVVNSLASVSILSCTFIANSGTAARISHLSETLIRGCSFAGNSRGISSQNGKAIIEDCDFNGNVEKAISVNSGEAIIRGCSFAATTFGVENNGGSATIEHCTFSGLGTAISNATVKRSVVQWCTFTGNGTAIYSAGLTNAVQSVENCTFSGHVGSVIRNSTSRVGIADCTFIGNKSISIHNTNSATANVTDCTFVGGTIGVDASSIFQEPATSSSALVRNSTFIGFTTAAINLLGSGSHGSPITYYRSSVTVDNCTFFDNAKGILGHVAAIDVANSIFRNGAIPSTGQIVIINALSTTNIVYSNVQGGFAGTGNINADPQFVQNPHPGIDGVYGTTDDNLGSLRLRSTSPSLDAGNNAEVPSDITTDLEGLPRIVDVPGGIGSGAIVDMGAYERPVDADNLAIVSWAIDVDAPQPMARVTFNSPILPSTLGIFDLQIRSILSSGGLGEAMLPASFTYDAAARQVSFVLPTNLADGNYRATFQANSVSNGYINAPGSATDHDFFLLSGDANRDRKVDLQDLMILAANWMGTGKVFTQGDFNRDGIVNAADLGILSMKWQSRMDAPLPSAPVPTAPPAARSPVRTPIRTPTRVIALL